MQKTLWTDAESEEEDNTKYQNINLGHTKPFVRIQGDNQFFFVGIHECIANLPIDENIRKNYTTWGEK